MSKLKRTKVSKIDFLFPAAIGILLIILAFLSVFYKGTPIKEIEQQEIKKQVEIQSFKELDTTITDDQIKCLAKNIYFEARGSSVEDQKGVAFVTINRTKDKRWPDKICDVVYQKRIKNGKQIGQFSWTTMSQEYRTIKNQQAWDQAVKIAKWVYIVKKSGEYKKYDFTDGSDHYYAPKLVNYVPNWAHDDNVVHKKQIGDHIFVKSAW